jgi:hypothetical protein
MGVAAAEWFDVGHNAIDELTSAVPDRNLAAWRGRG